ncbi:MAG: hypothetical protein HRT72_13490 [Flavobacteriales bacterium]|nr:hypothetical protein [Flavobacteriales bacterium]
MTTEVIWANFSSKLLGFIKARVDSSGNAEDILQDVFIKIHEHSHQLSDEDKLTSWVYQITRNTLIDFHRKKGVLLTEYIGEEPLVHQNMEANPQFVNCLMPFVKEFQISIEMLWRKQFMETFRKRIMPRS